VHFFRHLSIRRKLTVIIMLVAGLSLLLACSAFVAYEALTFRRTMVSNLATLTDILGANSAAPLLFNDVRAAEENLRALSAHPQILQAAIFNRDGRLFAAYARPDVAVSPPSFEFQARGYRFGDDALATYRPIVFSGETIGTVAIRADLSELYARLWRYASIVVIVLLAASLAALILSSQLQRVISQPLLQLAETVRRVSAEKTFSLHLPKTGEDEVGLLIDGFNSMLSQTAARHRELREAQDQLEQRVQERTQALEQETAARHRGEELIRRLAYHDSLTDLPNRLLFGDRLDQALARAERSHQMLAVLFLDLDRFKNINDTLGHAMGDKLLKAIALRLIQCLRGEDTVGRLGGDEFLILLPMVASISDATIVAEKLVETLREPYEVDGHRLYTTVSIGIAVFPLHGLEGETLIKKADAALYRAKELGRNNAQVYLAGTSDKALERLALENSLRRAIEANEFGIHFQPEVNPRNGAIVAVEALLRWRHADLGLLPPQVFVALAEEIGLSVQLGECALRAACRQGRAWIEQGPGPVSIAVNISARYFKHGGFAEKVERITREEGLPTHLLILEVTEGVFMDNLEDTVRTMRALKALGITLAIDDFGTGYSSLGYLKRFPIDILKIDRSFVQDIPRDADSAAIAKLIIDVAHNLGLRVIAEGVETEAQVNFLLSHDCDLMQGNFFGRALPADETTQLLESSR
jgi:diguanylate cyclase (GGDEF)-like protein